MKLMPGLTFSWRRAVGLSQLQARVSRTIGVPLSRSGRERKVGRAVIGAAVRILKGGAK